VPAGSAIHDRVPLSKAKRSLIQELNKIDINGSGNRAASVTQSASITDGGRKGLSKSKGKIVKARRLRDLAKDRRSGRKRAVEIGTGHINNSNGSDTARRTARWNSADSGVYPSADQRRQAPARNCESPPKDSHFLLSAESPGGVEPSEGCGDAGETVSSGKKNGTKRVCFEGG